MQFYEYEISKFTTTMSFICMTVKTHYSKSVKRMIIAVIQLSGYNFNIDIFHNIYPIFQKGSNQFGSHFKAL